jgi:hypothetical protein
VWLRVVGRLQVKLKLSFLLRLVLGPLALAEYKSREKK